MDLQGYRPKYPRPKQKERHRRLRERHLAVLARVHVMARLPLFDFLFYGVNDGGERKGYQNRQYNLGRYLWPLTYEAHVGETHKVEYSRDLQDGVRGWWDATKDGFCPSRVAVTEMVALLRSLAVVAATCRWHYVHGDRHVATTWMERIRVAGEPVNVLAATFHEFYDLVPEADRPWVSAESDHAFYRLFRAWGYKSCAAVQARIVDTFTVQRMFRTNKLDWDKLVDYVLHSDAMPLAEQEDIERQACTVVWASGYLPPHLCIEFGLTPDVPVTLLRYGEQNKRRRMAVT